MKTLAIHLEILSFFLLALTACNSLHQDEVERPNILWIIAEDLSPDLGCYGHPFVKTPHIDALSSKSVRFTHVFSTAPVCSPSRTALGTGMYQTSLNAHHMRYPDELKHPLPPSVIPLNELMRRQGYQTANIKDPPGRGKEDWSFRSALAAYDVTSWDSLSHDKPFFSVINLRLTHRPFEQDTLHPIRPDQVEIPPYYPDHVVSREDWASYLETVQVLDGLVGQVLDELTKRKFDQNTLVFFFSDHGRPMSRGKNYLYDSGTHIPLLVYCPDKLSWRQYFPPNTTNDQLISSIDLSATSLAIAGGIKPSWMQGRVLLGEQAEPAREFVFSAIDRVGETHFKTRSVRSKQYKYIRNFKHNFSINSSATAYRKQMHPMYHLLNILHEEGKLTKTQEALLSPMPEELLFDVEADPFEIKNLIHDDKHQKIVQQMRGELSNWQKRTQDYGMQEDTEAIVQAFEDYRQKSKSRNAKIKLLEQSVRADIDRNNRP